ncbi:MULTISPECIES: malonic semialdehyde reductase [Streptomyces]|uniref:malonic semialdehyde reductase n=1 Tax=Streptomyces TaxID=1883 RepID=UPI0004D88F4E|nr:MULTISPECIES: malonic semialdehyde reductase [Streptomyces]
MTTALSAPLKLDDETQDLLFRAARTASEFADEPVAEETVRAVYDLVKYGPTEFNSTPLRIVLIRSEEARARLLPCMVDANRDKTGRAPLVAVLAADIDFHEELPRLFPFFPQAKDVFYGDVAVRDHSAKLNAGLQIAYFIIGLRAAGLDVGPMSGFDAEAMDREFFPDGAHKSLVVLNIGKPAGEAGHPRLPRLEYDEVVTAV